MRRSRQRELIEYIIENRFDHPTADMIYYDARKIQPQISLGTIYRNLTRLVEEEKVITLETEDKKIHYDGRLEEHSHFICSACGKIIDIFNPAPIPSELEELGVSVVKEKCVYYGKCAECNK